MAIMPPINEPCEYNENYIFYWNHAGLELNRLTHSVQGPHGGPTISSRVLGILQLAVHDAYFSIHPPAGNAFGTYLDPNDPEPKHRLPQVPANGDSRQAVAGAAIAVLEAFYAARSIGSNFSFSTRDQLDQLLKSLIAGFAELDTLSPSFAFGSKVGAAMIELLAIKPNEPGADQGNYRPKDGRFKFRDEPTTPVRLFPVNPDDPHGPQRAARVYHAPFYGLTARRFAVQSDSHFIADPPVGFGTNDQPEYDDSLRDVVAMGGAGTLNSTKRKPDQTVGAYFWAYDGANLIGTPPRLYNQIIRRIAWENQTTVGNKEAINAEFARLFALANAAMADAGIYAWREKYHFEFWRPLTGVREHDVNSGPDATEGSGSIHPAADPFWLTLGAPETNTDKVSFKPPFPAYPSGHATFGAAAFQIVRRFYKDRENLTFDIDEPDEISFSFVSEELNGVSRDLRQPYDPSKPITDQPGNVRTRVVRKFPSLWSAIFENAMSRIWLGVHWRFDGFAAKDVLVPGDGDGPPYAVDSDGATVYQDPVDIRYVTKGPRADMPGSFPIGGVPLGLGIANEIYDAGLRQPPTPMQPDPQPSESGAVPKATQTNIL